MVNFKLSGEFIPTLPANQQQTPISTKTLVLLTQTPITSAQWVEKNLLLNEDFENNTKEKWSFYGGEWNIIKDESGNSVLEAKAGSSGSRAEVGDVRWSNYVLELKARVLQVSTTDYGETFDVVFREKSNCERYKWNMNETFTTLGRENPPNCQWKHFQNDDKRITGDWTLIRIEVFENNLTGFINGIKLFEITDANPVLSGKIELFIFSNAVVWFDDIHVTELVAK